MLKLLDTGKVKTVGVSNFSIPHIEALIKATGVVPVSTRHSCNLVYDSNAMGAVGREPD